ncbi:hypothetical protein IQ277_27845 [Nostocales cyanobacterium LEGE 12452]|nr:hypothetical protein [Nostocales cyanobacterium LEGE 12452]
MTLADSLPLRYRCRTHNVKVSHDSIETNIQTILYVSAPCCHQLVMLPEEEANQQLEQINQQLEQTNQQLEQERQRTAIFAERLRNAGIDPNQIL